MEEIEYLNYEQNGQLRLLIATEDEDHELNGFSSLFLNHIDKVLDSDFEDGKLFFRDQPYQKLKMSETGGNLLELTLSYPDSDTKDKKLEVEKERFEKFLKEVRDGLSDKKP